jgi:hypothetical protein
VTGAAGRAVADRTTGAALAGALRRLRARQRAAVLGAGHPDALDAAGLAHRRVAGRRLPASGAGVPAGVFARWLRAAGRPGGGPGIVTLTALGSAPADGRRAELPPSTVMRRRDR